MDELLSGIQQRKLKISEMNDSIIRLRCKIALSQPDRAAIYSQIRKLKEDEKNRAEKENWIVSIMRNTRQLSEEQMCHIYIKTNDMMKTINSHFNENTYQPPPNLMQFLETYYYLHQSFYQQLNMENHLRVQYRQSIKSGNVNLVTDLIKALLATSRKIMKDVIEELALQVNRDPSPEKAKLTKKLAPDPFVENLRARSTTQNGKKELISILAATNMIPNYLQGKIESTSGIIVNNTTNNNNSTNNDDINKYNDKKELATIKEKIRQQKRLIISSKIHSAYDLSPAESPMNNLRIKLQQIQQQQKDQDKTQIVSLFANITAVMDDLDDQNIVVLDYQCIKRQQQSFEEFKLNFESLSEKVRGRNQLVQQSITDYVFYVNRKLQQPEDFPNVLKQKYEELTKFPEYHFCQFNIKPMSNQDCRCSDINYRSCHSRDISNTQSPLKSKVVIRKSVQNIKKSQPQPFVACKPSINTFPTKSLIDQFKNQRSKNQSMTYEEVNQSSMEFTRPTQQSSPIAKQNQSILQIRKLEVYNPVQQYQLYAHRLSSDQPYQLNKSTNRAQSANGYPNKYMTSSVQLDSAQQNNFGKSVAQPMIDTNLLKSTILNASNVIAKCIM